MKALLGAGANPRVADKHQVCPLHFAVNWPVAQALLLSVKGIKSTQKLLHATDCAGHTVLHHATMEALRRPLSDSNSEQSADLEELIQKLVACGADPAKADLQGESPRTLVEKNRLDTGQGSTKLRELLGSEAGAAVASQL
eukprot:SAG31_NODE_8976_length_1354_cov_1.320319_2_plen_141_part_00